jgi:hypothetical protein
MVRRGSIGDSSDNDFSDAGGGSETDTGSGVTGDDGADTSYGGGDPTGGVSGDPDGGAGTIGDSDIPDDPDPTDGGDFDPNPSRREVGGADDQDVSDVGRSSGRAQSTGDAGDQNDTLERTRDARERAAEELSRTATSSQDSKDSGAPSGRDDTRGGIDIREGDTSSRGVGITRGPEGVDVVTPDRESADASTETAEPLRQRRQRQQLPPQGGDITLRRASSAGPQGGDIRLRNAAARQTPERFGDADFSAGLGGPEDEVEQVTDERIPLTVRNRITRPARNIIDDVNTSGTGVPVGVAGAGVVGQSSPAQLGTEFATDLTRTADTIAQAPAAGLEAAETAGFVAGVVDDPQGESTAVERAERVGAAGAAAAVAAGESAAENPQATARKAVTATATGAIGRAVTPVKVSRFDVPTESGTTTVRAARTRLPGVEDRTIVGARGVRPTRGTPGVDPDSVDLREVGGRADRAFEPVGQFETDVMRSTARRAGDDAAERAEAVNDLVREADSLGRRGTDFDAESAEEVVGNARRVPDGAEQEIANTLRDMDATVFGSAATRAQLRDARQPNDLDIVVEDKTQAKRRLRETLEDENAEVGDVFDIKEADEAPSKAQGGEPLKFGRESQAPRTIDGLRVNPASEELVRKAGASGFFRERGAGGTDEFDVGPQPRRPGRTDVREKDVTDAADFGEELLGAQNRPLGEFRRAFDESPERAADPATLRERLRVDEFRDATRAQAGLPSGRTRRVADGDGDVDTGPQRARGDDDPLNADQRRRDRSPDGDGRAGRTRRVSSPSPVGSPDDGGGGLGASPTGLGSSDSSPSPTGVAGDGSPSPVGSPGGRDRGAPSPAGSPTGGRDDGREIVPFSPTGGDDTTPSPTGSPTGDGSPTGGVPTSPAGGTPTPPGDPINPSDDDEIEFDGEPDRGSEDFTFSGDLFDSGIVEDPFDVNEEDFS